MGIKLKEVLDIYTPQQVDDFLKKYTGVNLTEPNLKSDKLEDFYCPVGGNYNNNSTAGMLTKPDKGLIEKITNGIDAVLEKQKEIQKLANPKTAEEIILGMTGSRANLVNVIVADSGIKSRPTIDVIDKGTGIPANKFVSTILSLQNGNKTTIDKSYLIGTFGQGGTTALPFSYATIIVSKHSGAYAFTIIREYHFSNMKMSTFIYYKPNNEIVTLEDDGWTEEEHNEYLKHFLDSESGTLIRMIQTEVTKEYYDNDVTKPTELIDYIGTEIYNSPIPIYVRDYRSHIRNLGANQGRNVIGNGKKLESSKKHLYQDFESEFPYRNIACKVRVRVILPDKSDDSDWGKDSKCKAKYKEYNMHEKPIIYLSNGQYIGGTNYTKIKNRGLPHLQYRLLVEVDLDIFGDKKYKIISTSRDGLKDVDFVKEFEDVLIDKLCGLQILKDLDMLIAKKSVKNTLSEETINRLQNKFSKKYSSFLKLRKPMKEKPTGKPFAGPIPTTLIMDDEVSVLNIALEDNKEFYKDQKINIGLITHATKQANENAKIYAYISENGGKFSSTDRFAKTCLNERIMFHGGNLKPGTYKIQFGIYDKKAIESEIRNFIIKDENQPDGEEDLKTQSKGLNFKIVQEDDKELVIDMFEDNKNKLIVFTVCLSHDMLHELVFEDIKPSDLDDFKASLIEPLVGFVLGLGEEYDKLEPELKNKMATSLCLSLKNIDK